MKSAVLITGAGTGIGKATAERFLRAGHPTILVGRRKELLDHTAQAHPKLSQTFACDITSEKQVDELTQSFQAGELKQWLLQQSAQLSFLINNAGIYKPASFEKSTPKEWSETFTTNLYAPVYLTQKLLPLLKASAPSGIVNISSTLGILPIPDASAYSASKAAMNNWTLSLALELAPFQVRVNCVCPGIVETPIHSWVGDKKQIEKLGPVQPLGRVGQPEEIAHSVYHFCAPGSEWTTGSILRVDGGIGLL